MSADAYSTIPATLGSIAIAAAPFAGRFMPPADAAALPYYAVGGGLLLLALALAGCGGLGVKQGWS